MLHRIISRRCHSRSESRRGGGPVAGLLCQETDRPVGEIERTLRVTLATRSFPPWNLEGASILPGSAYRILEEGGPAGSDGKSPPGSGLGGDDRRCRSRECLSSSITCWYRIPVTGLYGVA
ncbi:hypothetical protein KM043_012085 [Ampulex compressa]|nr:hypothetical protein KM043_012085 [Ampulex compressa]